MIEQVGQGRMLARLKPTALSVRRSAECCVLVDVRMAPALSVALTPCGSRVRSARDRATAESAPSERQVEQTQREEGEAILALADAALAGKPVPSDFSLRVAERLRQGAARHVRAVHAEGRRVSVHPAIGAGVRAGRFERSAEPRADAGERKRAVDDRGEESTYPVDAIFPVDLTALGPSVANQPRVFGEPGEYDVFVVMRERVDPAAPRTRPKAAVVRQPLSVPDFRTGELTTSSVILADRLTVLTEPVPADRLAERPYAIGRNEITPAVDRRFGRDEELIVVFLVYNPMVTPERQFDVRVDYHFFRKVGAGQQARGEVARGRIRRSGRGSGISTAPIRSASTRH